MAQNIFDLTATWNNAGTAWNGIKLNVTDTASHVNSKLLWLGFGGTEKFSIDKSGNITVNGSSIGTSLTMHDTGAFGISTYLTPNGVWYRSHYGTLGSGFRMNSAGYYGWTNGSGAVADADLTIYRDAADILAQRRGTNPQAFRLYNSWTDASNYERGFMRFASNVLEIGTEAGGTGTGRNLTLAAAGSILTLSVGGNPTAAIQPNAFGVRSGDIIGWSANATNPSSAFDLLLYRDTADTLALRRGASPQTLRLYNTFTDASNYERAFIGFSGNNFFVGTEKGGTGASRDMYFMSAGSINFRVNGSGSSAWTINTSGHLLPQGDGTYDIGASGTNRLRNLYSAGSINVATNATFDVLAYVIGTNNGLASRGSELSLFANGISIMSLNASSQTIQLHGSYAFAWVPGHAQQQPADTFLLREAADTLAMRRTTNPQALRLYNTWTDASNYERGIFGWTSNTLIVGTEKAGTGSARSLQFQVGGTGIFQIQGTTGHLAWNADNAYDIGVGGGRPRNLLVAGTGTFGGNVSMNNLSANSIGAGASPSGTAWGTFGPSTTNIAHLRLQAGVAPSAPNNGDIWFDGTDLKMQIGGVTKTFTLA